MTAQVESPLPDLTVLLPVYGMCEAVWTPVQCLLPFDQPFFQYTIGDGAAGTLLVQVSNARCPATKTADPSFPIGLCLPCPLTLLQQNSGL